MLNIYTFGMKGIVLLSMKNDITVIIFHNTFSLNLFFISLVFVKIIVTTLRENSTTLLPGH